MKRGFTLIELVMVIVILGVLAATALPRFIDLSGQARIAAAQGALGGFRAAVAIEYASNAAAGNATLIPSAVTTDMFADGRVPNEPMSNSSSIFYNSIGVPTVDGSGWRYDSVAGRVWINDKDYSDY